MSTLQDPVHLPLTYESYMAEDEVNRRYEIIDGVRRFMTNPTRRHQVILLTIAGLFKAYAKGSRSGQVQIAPCDILIRRFPLRTRQPDVLFISPERLAANPPPDDPAPLSPAPELVVEIISPSETESRITEKLADFRKVDVRECWVVHPTARTVEVIALAREGSHSIGTYGEGTIVSSRAFPGLDLSVDDVFSE
jgi:Uma2 family endonuclease